MNSVVVAGISFLAFYVAYWGYGRFLSRKIFKLDDSIPTPAHQLRDDIDYVPTRKVILFGHHYSSIAGAGPIVGPAIAVIWGWVPALIWIVLGAIFLGGVHDLGSLIVSVRHQGKSVGFLARTIIHPTVQTLFLLIVFFLLILVISVFMLVISILFVDYPASIFPIWIQIPIAMTFGYMIYYRKGKVLLWGTLAFIFMYLTIFYSVGTAGLNSFHIPALIGSELFSWHILLVIYCFFASTLPVQILLQPRDYINSNMLIAGLVLLFGGLIALHPQITAPAISLAPTGAPPILPILFITVACGAISGFHSMIASGTSAKQIGKESDARFIGYGAMLVEGVLAVLVVMACTAGLGSAEAWTGHYTSWAAAEGLDAKIGAFVEGSSNFLNSLGIGKSQAAAIIAVMVIAFAATTLDTSTRILRYVISELGEQWSVKPLRNRYLSTGVGLIFCLSLAVLPDLISRGRVDGGGGMLLWPLFGTGNQLLGGLALLVVTIWLIKIKRPIIYTLIPLVFLLLMTGWAMVENFIYYIAERQFHLLTIGVILMALEIVMIYHALKKGWELRKV